MMYVYFCIASILVAGKVLSESCPAKKQGCYKHNNKMEHLLHSDRQEHVGKSFHSGKKIDWDNMKEYIPGAICRCEKVAEEEGYPFFSLRHFGECHGIPTLRGMVKSLYCFRHDDSICLKHHEKCTGADEGETVYKVNLKPPQKAKTHQRIFCEHRPSQQISCPKGTVIDIVSSFYGRKSNRHCGSSYKYNLNCAATSSNQIIKSLCNQKSSCRINPHNGVFGDPCVYTVKYVDVKYRCVKSPGQVLTATFCEHKGAKNIICPQGKSIKVINGYYGRLSKCCGYKSFYNNKCVAKDSERKIKASCDGKNRCSLNPHNSVYGDPCVKTVKYIKVKYVCE